MTLLAIDPGNKQSAYVVVNEELFPVAFGKVPNSELLGWLPTHLVDRCVIEMVASYGMAVGADVFETCVWIGRFAQTVEATGLDVQLIKRNAVKVHLCGSSRAKDGNITQALVDRFAPGQPNRGKGTKGDPGFFYGFSADVWQAYALAVFAADTAEVAA